MNNTALSLIFSLARLKKEKQVLLICRSIPRNHYSNAWIIMLDKDDFMKYSKTKMVDQDSYYIWNLVIIVVFF